MRYKNDILFLSGIVLLVFLIAYQLWQTSTYPQYEANPLFLYASMHLEYAMVIYSLLFIALTFYYSKLQSIKKDKYLIYVIWAIDLILIPIIINNIIIIANN